MKKLVALFALGVALAGFASLTFAADAVAITRAEQELGGVPGAVCTRAAGANAVLDGLKPESVVGADLSSAT